uniref:19.6 kDa protein n=1 Tax=Grapevine leafroll-associated virus 3 TaxID=55951 RepID=A0A345T8D2_9CLOS|nr:19.6 kDa protein [Grapevine leafroll-associated virus 3]AXI82237.1 19.6 kDa protein [Grapevine leafroll-associated virus 3]
MKLYSLHFLILKLSKSIKTNAHFDLILTKEALINYYNQSFTSGDAVSVDAKESIARFLVERARDQKSCGILKALINHTFRTMTVEAVRAFVGDLILVADASIAALEEVKGFETSRRLLKKKGGYYYSGRCGSDIAKVGYTLVGVSRGKDSRHSLKLHCEGKTSDGCLLQYIIVSSLG